MKINLVIEEDKDGEKFDIYLSGKVLATCYGHEEVEAFLKDFENNHLGDNIILRFS